MISASILVVEDERIVAMHLRQQLIRLGYQVPAMATSGAQALAFIRDLQPDVVLMDIHIEGDIDGIETAARIPPDPLTPVIYLTAYSEEATLARARATNPYGFLLKPFSERELHACIQMVLERRRGDRQAREKAEALEAVVQARTAALAEAQRDLQHQIDERIKAERALHQAQKMEAVGQLTGGIAHDFNNMLTVIVGNLESIARSGELTSARGLRALDHACQGAARATGLTQRLLAFSRRQPLNPQNTDINGVVAGMSELLHSTVGETVSLAFNLRDDLLCTYADENQVANALLNLVLNARDAMPGGGGLSIETANVRVEAEAQIGALTPGDYVLVSIADAGQGMSQSVLERAVEPFFTTKPAGQGTGLGLSQIYGFAHQSGGEMTIESEEGVGTTVRLYLPALAPAADDAAVEPVAAPEPGPVKGETVLVVEDDQDVMAYSIDILNELGYRVLAARDGPAALTVLHAEPEVDLIFTDVGLPGGLSGRQLADEVRRLWPERRVVFTSGYAPSAVMRDGEFEPGVVLLSKPFSFTDFAAKLRDVLDAPPQARSA